ncbi:putative FAD-linked oxidoreductase [Penicillium rolfsii]|nr:putative FAD-linked oxidoreductase [Penicillium rolfsii]
MGKFDLGEVVALVANVTTGNCQQACAQLQATTDLPADFAQGHFAKQQQNMKPLCVVHPNSSDDVLQIVNVVRERQCQFAVKGGGHGNYAGASNIQDGLLIDMSRIKSVTPSNDESIAGIGAGARWIDVYEVLEPKGLAVVGGRSSTIGVAGFTLGGGISFLSRRYGWAVDNVANYELVLANGTITNVNQSSNQDLFFALRGGGNNFGIVTRFDFETCRHALVSGGTTVFLMQDLEDRRTALGLKDRWHLSVNSIISQVNKHLFRMIGRFGFSVHSRDIIREFVALADEKQTDAGAHAYMFLTWVPTYHAYFLGMTSVYSGPEASSAVFQNISSMRRLYTTQRTANISDFANEVEAQNMELVNQRNQWRTVTLKVDADLISDIIDIYLAAVHPYTSIPSAIISCNLQLLTKHEIEIFAKNGGNALGIRPEDGPLFFFSLTHGYSDAADDARFIMLNDQIMDKIISVAKERGLYHPFIYQNYAGAGQNVYAGYGAENRARLSEIQKKYDPEGVFWKLQPGYFKV